MTLLWEIDQMGKVIFGMELNCVVLVLRLTSAISRVGEDRGFLELE